MRIAPARLAAFAALLAVERGAWSAEALASKSARLDARDAGLASDIVFGVLRRRGELDWMIARLSSRPTERLDAEVLLTLRMAIYQMHFLSRIPDHAAVNDAVELVRRAGKERSAAFVNAVLRNFLREPGPDPDPCLSTPEWLLTRWCAHYGEETARAIAEAGLRPPGRYIRVGPATPPEGAEPAGIAGCYRLDTGDSMGFRFQDISSQTVVPLLDLQPGQTFLDVCAAPGNKTAQAMESGVLAIACELHPSRAKTLLPLGIPVVVADATCELPFSRGFDRVLVDAPCTGTGTLARNPEIKWRLTNDDVFDLRRRQSAILRNAIKLVKPGGRLVYSTCSLEREENEDVLARVNLTAAETIQRIPGRDEGDGFYAAAIDVI